MQDNAPCHKTRKVISFLERKRIPTLDWPPQSPDLNPIENIWNIIKTCRYKKFGIPHSKVELIEQIFKIREELTVEDAENCIGNMERRFQEVVRMNGRPTRYWIKSNWKNTENVYFWMGTLVFEIVLASDNLNKVDPKWQFSCYILVGQFVSAAKYQAVRGTTCSFGNFTV